LIELIKRQQKELKANIIMWEGLVNKILEIKTSVTVGLGFGQLGQPVRDLKVIWTAVFVRRIESGLIFCPSPNPSPSPRCPRLKSWVIVYINKQIDKQISKNSIYLSFL
jgi:hypothetical protein